MARSRHRLAEPMVTATTIRVHEDTHAKFKDWLDGRDDCRTFNDGLEKLLADGGDC